MSVEVGGVVVDMKTTRKYSKSAIIIHCETQSPNPKSEEANATLRNSRVKRIT
jgi:hypothetical protein